MDKHLSYYDDTSGTKYLYCHIPQVVVNWAMAAFKNKKSRENTLKLYALIHFKYDRNKGKKEKKGKSTKNLYVELGHRYFELSVCNRYYIYLKALKDAGFIDTFKSLHQDPNDMYNQISKESYHPGKKSKRYRPSILPVESDPLYQFDQTGINHTHTSNKVYQKNLKFLKNHNFPEKIFRDTYMNRYYTSVTNNYNELFFTGASASQFVLYDIPSSIPQFMKEFLEDQERPIDEKFKDLFNGYFYDNFGDYLLNNGLLRKPISRERAKKLFVTLVFGKSNQKPQQIVWHLYKEMPNFMREVKHGLGYKAVRMEAKYLEKTMSKINGPALTVHDSIILTKKGEKRNMALLKRSKFEMKEPKLL